MKQIQKFSSKEAAVGQVRNTPYLAVVNGQTNPVYGLVNYGNEVTLIRDFDDTVVCVLSILKTNEWVDLGLPSGKKWASCNFTSTESNSPGTRYAWGLKVSKVPFNASNYSFPPVPITDISKIADFDVIYSSTNNEGCLPSKADFEELIDNTTQVWCKTSAIVFGAKRYVEGMLFVSKTDPSKKIFIIAAGYMLDYQQMYTCFTANPGVSDVAQCYLWSSTKAESDTAYCLCCSAQHGATIETMARNRGMYLRAIKA